MHTWILAGLLWAGTAEAAPKQAKLDQEQAVGLTLMSNAGEVMFGTTMVGRTADPEVRAFAQRLIDEHGAANEKLIALIEQQGVQPKESPLREKKSADLQKELGMLWGRDPSANLDQRFMTAMIEEHRHDLAEIDTLILPALRSEELKGAVTDLRATVAEHLRVACTIGQRIGSETQGCPGMQPATE